MLKTNVLLFASFILILLAPALRAELFKSEKLTELDSVFVVDQSGDVLFDWRSTKPMVPASLTKLATAYAAISKRSIEYAFHSDFYRMDDQLWIKGYGDPYLVSEEIDLLVDQLRKLDLSGINSLHIDGSFFANESVPGRSQVNDPYNAPLSAVAANFNTVMLRKRGGELISAETQTPLTGVAKKVAAHPIYGLSDLKTQKSKRLNLHLYRYVNSHALDQIIQGMLKYSNNFMANQLFLSLAESPELDSVDFESASTYIEETLSKSFNWSSHRIVEGSGLSRMNRLSARQIDDLLVALKPYKYLFKETPNVKAQIRAKTGTLDRVRSFAGYVDFEEKSYRFVFIFNRQVPWRHREQLLEKLVEKLSYQQVKD